MARAVAPLPKSEARERFVPAPHSHVLGRFCVLIREQPAGDRFAEPEWQDHRYSFLIPPVLISKCLHQISLLKLDSDEDVKSGRDREDQMRHSHRRCCPERKQPSKIKRMTNVTIDRRG